MNFARPLFLFLFCTRLLTSFERDHLVLEDGTINVLTGQPTLSKQDFVIEGTQPLILRRVYIHEDEQSAPFWLPIPHHRLILTGDKDTRSNTFRPFLAKTYTSDGIVLRFRKHPRKGFTLSLPKGALNTYKTEISAKTNLKNYALRANGDSSFALHCPDGSERVYQLGEKAEKSQLFLLQSERLPNGRHVLYSYDEYSRLKEIHTTNPSKTKTYAWAQFQYSGKEKTAHCQIRTSDGQKGAFKYGANNLLEKVENGFFPNESFSYTSLKSSPFPVLHRTSFSGGRFTQFEYDAKTGKVTSLKSPLGNGEEEVETHRLSYETGFRIDPVEGKVWEGKTVVKKADNSEIVIHFNAYYFPTKIAFIRPNKQLDHAYQMEWKSGGDLKKKTLLDANNQPVWVRTYTYDRRGNVIKETLSGDLYGKGEWETEIQTCEYDSNNRPICINKPGGKLTRVSYLKGTDLVTGEWIGNSHSIKQRTLYEYDKDHTLVRKIIDDGTSLNCDDLFDVNVRKITEIDSENGKTTEVREKAYRFGTEKLLKRTCHIYKENSCTTEIYGENEELFSTTEERTNDQKKIVFTSNALGETRYYQYDVWQNLLSEESEGKRNFSYDLNNQLIEERQGDQVTRHRYSINTHEIIDPLGHITTLKTDFLGRVIEKQLPFVYDEEGKLNRPKFTYHYDAMGNLVEEIDPIGARTLHRYTAKGQLCATILPDGAKKTYTYFPDGTLETHTSLEGAKTTFSRDLFGREIRKEVHSKNGELLFKEEALYDAFHLLSQTNGKGVTTYFDYDFASRKQSEVVMTRSGPVETQFEYDPIGRLNKVQLYFEITCYEYDPLNRIIEKRIEDADGNLLRKSSYTFDRHGNQNSQTVYYNSGPSTTITEKDPWGQTIKTIDPVGNETYYTYSTQDDGTGYLYQKKITTHPSGAKTIELFDGLGRRTQKNEENHQGRLLSSHSYSYTLRGELVKDEDKTYTYDIRGNLAKKRIGEELYTYTYTPSGNIQTLLKPDGIRILYSYTPLGQLAELATSDGTVHYKMEYNGAGEATSIQDLIQNVEGKRTFDDHGHLIKEQFLNRKTLSSTYDLMGRRLEIHLPDESSIEFFFEAKDLTEIRRKPKYSDVEYRQRLIDYDLIGFPTKQRLSHGYGELKYQFNKKGEIVRMDTPYFSQSVASYDPKGHPEMILTNGIKHKFLGEGQDHADVPLPFTYTCDGLGRITGIKTPEKQVIYTYDVWNRLMTKKVFEDIRGDWTLITSLAYLYDGKKDIGAYDLISNYVSELRVCADQPINTADNAIVYELEGKPYIPLHDLFGNTQELLSVLRNKKMESYRFDSSGQETITDYWEDVIPQSKAGNPWRFGCYRTEEESGLIFVDGYFYSPKLGRFLSNPLMQLPTKELVQCK